MTTSETLSTTPNQLSEPEGINKRAFTIAEVEALRARLHDVELADGESQEDFIIRQQLNNKQEISAYAIANGFNENHQKYSALTTRLQDIVQTPENYWYVGPRVYNMNALGLPVKDAEGNDTYDNASSGQEKVWGLQSELFGGILPETEDTTEEEHEQETSLEESRTLLGERRNALAELSAKRQGRIAGNGGEAYAEAKELYDEQMIRVAKQELGNILADDTISDNDKKIRVTEHLLNEQATLRQETIKNLENTPVGKFIKWFTKDGKVATIAKGVLLGVGAGVIGAGIGVVAGVAGAAAIGAGVATAATTAVRFARGFAHADARGGRGMQQLDVDTQKTELATSLDDNHENSIDVVAAQLGDMYEKDTKREQTKRLKSVGAGALGIVLGAGVVTAAHAVLDAGVFDGFGNRNLTGGGHVGATQSPAPSGEQPGGNGGHGDQSPHDIQKEADDLAKKNGIPSSDTPGVVEAIKDALGGGSEGSPSSGWTPGGVDNYITGSLGGTEFTSAGLANFESWASDYTVQSGDTIWGLSEKYLQAQGITNPSVYQIDAVKDAVLADFQTRGIVGMNGWLSAGQSLHVK